MLYSETILENCYECVLFAKEVMHVLKVGVEGRVGTKLVRSKLGRKIFFRFFDIIVVLMISH